MKSLNIIKKYSHFLLIFALIITIIIIIYIYNNNYKCNKNKKFEYVYKENILDKNDFNLLLSELDKYNDQLERSDEKMDFVLRKNMELNSPIIANLIKKYENKIKKLVDNQRIYLANNHPIEYRKYFKGSYMSKHTDELIYKIPQYECVLTIINNTDSTTNLGKKRIHAKPNSIIIVKAKGIEHEVTPVNQGERKFLKFIFTETDEFANKS